jgi:hypothetical protein
MMDNNIARLCKATAIISLYLESKEENNATLLSVVEEEMIKFDNETKKQAKELGFDEV